MSEENARHNLMKKFPLVGYFRRMKDYSPCPVLTVVKFPCKQASFPWQMTDNFILERTENQNDNFQKTI